MLYVFRIGRRRGEEAGDAKRPLVTGLSWPATGSHGAGPSYGFQRLSCRPATDDCFGKYSGRFAREKFSVRNHFIGLWIHRYFRLPGVMNHVRFSKVANAADRHDPFGQPYFA